MSWETFIVSQDNPQGSPNLNIFKAEDGSLVKNFIQKKQINWYIYIDYCIIKYNIANIGSRSGVKMRYYFQG